MLGNYLIGLREGLEAALVIGILIAYLVRTGRQHLIPRVWAGVAAAVAISLAFGALLTFGPRRMADRTEELIAGSLSLLAVGFVTWMIFWMAGAARGLGSQLRSSVDAAAEAGTWSLATVALLAVGREGLETALFLWAATQAAASGGASSSGPLVGAALGLGSAVLLGWAIYKGALKIDLTKFFTWTGAFLILVAAGVLAYAVHEFQEAGVLGGEDDLLFDISGVMNPDSWYAAVLKGVFNFSPRMTVVQVVAWIVYAVPVMALFFAKVRRKAPLTQETSINS